MKRNENRFRIGGILFVVALLFADRHALAQPDSGSAEDINAKEVEIAIENRDFKTLLTLIRSIREGGLKSVDITKHLIVCAKFRNAPEDVRAEALLTIATSASEDVSDEAATVLSSMSVDDSAMVREAAAIALGELSRDNKMVVEALIAASQDSSPNVRGAALRAMGNKREGTDAVIQQLLRGLSDRGNRRYAVSRSFYAERPVCVDALFGLGCMGEIAGNHLDEVMTLMLDNDENVALAASMAVAKISKQPLVHEQVEIALWQFLDIDGESSSFACSRCRAALECVVMLAPPSDSPARKKTIHQVMRLLRDRESLENCDLTIPACNAAASFGSDAKMCVPALRRLRQSYNDSNAPHEIDAAIERIECSN